MYGLIKKLNDEATENMNRAKKQLELDAQLMK